MPKIEWLELSEDGKAVLSGEDYQTEALDELMEAKEGDVVFSLLIQRLERSLRDNAI